MRDSARFCSDGPEFSFERVVEVDFGVFVDGAQEEFYRLVGELFVGVFVEGGEPSSYCLASVTVFGGESFDEARVHVVGTCGGWCSTPRAAVSMLCLIGVGWRDRQPVIVAGCDATS